jgi:hypothetical protein
MGQDEGGAGDVTDFAGAGGDVLEGAPAAGYSAGRAWARAAVMSCSEPAPPARHIMMGLHICREGSCREPLPRAGREGECRRQRVLLP